MTASIGAAKWLEFTQREYLATFIREGGAAVKFAVPLEDGLRDALMDGIADAGENAGYLVVKINAAETKVHMADEIFFRVASQVPWSLLSRMAIARLAAESGYSWAAEGDEPLYLRLAAKNGIDPQMLLLDLKKAIGEKVLKQRNLSRDFLVAMTHLCIAELAGGQDGATAAQAIVDWLTGANKAVSAIKPYQIFRKINRATARYFFESTVHWLRFAGYPGMVAILDAQRITLARNPRDQRLYYTRAGVLDAYEVLRQFIDGTDKLEGVFIAVIPDLAFLEDEGRGLSAYEALKFRIVDEVHDRNLVNPMASLARISASGRGD